MSMCESILTIALVCTVKYLHYCDYYYTLGNDSQSTPKLIAYKTGIMEDCTYTATEEGQTKVRTLRQLLPISICTMFTVKPNLYLS